MTPLSASAALNFIFESGLPGFTHRVKLGPLEIDVLDTDGLAHLDHATHAMFIDVRGLVSTGENHKTELFETGNWHQTSPQSKCCH